MEVTTVFSLLGGLGLFLFGIKTMGDGLEQAAGSKMKRLLEALTPQQADGPCWWACWSRR